MKRFKQILLLGVLLGLTGCATTGIDNRSFTGVTKDSGTIAASGQSTVVLYRKTSMATGIAVGVKVFIDGVEVANIGHDQFKIIAISSGLREVRVSVPIHRAQRS
jgi:hypothetical protein